jgi:hypothetical protein
MIPVPFGRGYGLIILSEVIIDSLGPENSLPRAEKKNNIRIEEF